MLHLRHKILCLKKLDWYIIKKFLTTFFFSLLLFLVIAIVIDLVERLDDFMSSSAPVSLIITNYYLPFLPWIGAQLFPLFVFLSVMFFTSKMAGESEIIAMLGNSVSYYRILRPYLFTALLLAGLLYFGNHYLVPWSNAKKLDFVDTYFYGGRKEAAQSTHIRISKNEFIYLENFNTVENEGYKFGYEKFNNGKLIYKLTADKIEWNYQKKNWNLFHVVMRNFDGMNETFTTANKINQGFAVAPTDFEKRQAETKEIMSTPVLSAFIAKEELRGDDNLEQYYVERLRRTAAAYSLLIMTLIAFAVAGKKTRGGIGAHIAIGLVLSATYILFMQMSTTFSNQAGLNPYLGVWLPNILFTGIAIYLLRIAQK